MYGTASLICLLFASCLLLLTSCTGHWPALPKRSAAIGISCRGFAENGPFTIKTDLTLEDNPYGWDVSHNMVYVDQPIGTGYSYSTDPADTVHGETGNSTSYPSNVSPFSCYDASAVAVVRLPYPWCACNLVGQAQLYSHVHQNPAIV